MIASMYSTGVQIVARTSGTWRCHYLFNCFLCADRHGGADNYPCVCCWKIVACSERDMAYATILVRFVYFITGTLIKKVGRDVMDKDFVYIRSSIFLLSMGLMLLRAAHRGA